MSDEAVFTLMQELLASLSNEVEARRLELLRGRRILIVMGFYEGKLSMYQRARELGVKLVMLDGPDHWTKEYVDTGLFESFIEVDLNEDQSRLERVLSAIRASGLHFDGVATFCEFATTLTAQIAAALHLPGHRVQSTQIARNKYQMRKVCADEGFPTPRFALISSPNDVIDAAAYVGFPAVLKPVSGAASKSVYRVNNLWELQDRYRRNMDLYCQTSHDQTFNSDGDHMDAMVWEKGSDMILEEFLEGDEFDIDCLLSDGQLVYASVTGEDPQPEMIETGACLPSDYPAYRQAELVELARQALKLLKFSNGAFHVEAKYTSRGPRLLEVNARIGGGSVYLMNKMVWGVDLVAQYLLTCLGISIRPQKAETPLTHLAIYDFVAPYSGVVICNNFLDHLKDDPRIGMIDNHLTVGQHVVGPREGVPDYLAEVIVCGESCKAARQALQAITAQVDLMIQPDTILNVLQVA